MSTNEKQHAMKHTYKVTVNLEVLSEADRENILMFPIGRQQFELLDILEIYAESIVSGDREVELLKMLESGRGLASSQVLQEHVDQFQKSLDDTIWNVFEVVNDGGEYVDFLLVERLK